MFEEAKLTEYENKLKDCLFLCGNAPGPQDAEVLEATEKEKFVPDQEKYPNFWAWYSLVVLYEQPIVESWKKAEKEEPKGKGPKGPKGGKKKEEKKEGEAKKEDDDDFDPFAEETAEDKAELEKMKEKNKKDDKKKKKKAEVQKSIILLDVKGYEADQDLDSLAKKIFEEQKREALLWKTEYKKEEVAFGVKKLVIGCALEDEKVGLTVTVA